MRVLITGIDGFTGVYLEQLLLSNGYEVFGTTIGKPIKSTHHTCDITNIEQLQDVLNKIKPDYIINLAAISFVVADPLKMYQVNLFGTLNILESLITLNQTPKKIILASSAAVYGNQNGSLSEEHETVPINHYGNSKLAMENMAKNYFDKLNVLIVRPFNYTGEGQEQHFLIPKIISHYKSQKKVIELGNINVFREYNNINDIASAYLKLMISDVSAEIVNLCSGRSYSIVQILSKLNKLLDYEIKVDVNPLFVRKNEIVDLKGNPSKLLNLVGEDHFKNSIDDTLFKMLMPKQ